MLISILQQNIGKNAELYAVILTTGRPAANREPGTPLHQYGDVSILQACYTGVQLTFWLLAAVEDMPTIP
ncbi:hypothetical protein VTP01DRAFT_353 [Rhizomucor pusillus]|uniref:uncharacterized protein n=1 Tax=Rhizomucor pusillus TaxID=4840 RepID=UPI0037433126